MSLLGVCTSVVEASSSVIQFVMVRCDLTVRFCYMFVGRRNPCCVCSLGCFPLSNIVLLVENDQRYQLFVVATIRISSVIIHVTFLYVLKPLMRDVEIWSEVLFNPHMRTCGESVPTATRFGMFFNE